ncbi:MAG: hypothetical protein PUG48_06815 [Clostridia bacterium]|nr:hypothetical protein [Clostridia bacterium]
MDIIGKWKVKELNIPTVDGVKTFTPETLPDDEDFEDYKKGSTQIFEFKPDGTLNTLMPIPEDMIEVAKEEGMEILDGGYALLDSTVWKENDGKFFFDSKIEGEFLGETVDSFMEIKVTPDGCLLHQFDTLLLEKA